MIKYFSTVILCSLTITWGSVIYSAERLEKPDFIKSPLDWALGYFLISRGEGSQIARTSADLDHDEIDELFLGWPAAGGRNGMPFIVFKKIDGGYKFLGELFFRENFVGFKVLPLSDNGKIRFAQYWAHGGCEGTIQIFTHDGMRFSVVSSEKICAGDGGTEEGNMRFREVFDD